MPKESKFVHALGKDVGCLVEGWAVYDPDSYLAFLNHSSHIVVFDVNVFQTFHDVEDS